jgi:hypothetical protein
LDFKRLAIFDVLDRSSLSALAIGDEEVIVLVADPFSLLSSAFRLGVKKDVIIIEVTISFIAAGCRL